MPAGDDLSAAPGGAVCAIGASTSTIGGNVYLARSTSIGVDDPLGNLVLGGEIIDNGIAGASTPTKMGQCTLTVHRFGGAAIGVGGAPVPMATNIAAGVARVASSGGAIGPTSPVCTLSIASGATLDLPDTSMVIDHDGENPAQSIRGHLEARRLIASTRPANVRIGYGEALSRRMSTYAGQLLDLTSLFLTSTLAGDANLDGNVDFAVLLALAKSYNNAALWADGDFDSAGRVNFGGLLLLARNFGLTQTANAANDSGLYVPKSRLPHSREGVLAAA